MADYSTEKGFTVQTLASDPYATAIEAGTWASGGSLNTGVMLAAGFGASQTASLKTGGEPSRKAATETYNGTAWTEVADLNTARVSLRGFGTTAAGIVAGGNAPGSANSQLCESWNGTSWSEVNNMLTGRQNPGAVGISTAGMLAGGNTGPPTAYETESETYNGTSWTEGSDINTARTMMPGGGTTTAGIIAGGESPNPTPGPSLQSANAETYDGTSWSEQNNLNTARWGLSGSSAGTTSAMSVYVGASVGGATTHTQTENYNGTSWSEIADLAPAKTYLAGASTAAAASIWCWSSSTKSTNRRIFSTFNRERRSRRTGLVQYNNHSFKRIWLY